MPEASAVGAVESLVESVRLRVAVPLDASSRHALQSDKPRHEPVQYSLPHVSQSDMSRHSVQYDSRHTSQNDTSRQSRQYSSRHPSQNHKLSQSVQYSLRQVTQKDTNRFFEGSLLRSLENDKSRHAVQ